MVKIRHAREKDIPRVAELESEIDGENAASLETLMGRFKMFPEGFIVAENRGGIIGYTQSCRWNKEAGNFHNFKEIRDFQKHHDERARNLYVIFLAVDENYRKNGIGSSLIKSLIKYSVNNQIEKIQLVARSELRKFYSSFGMKPIMELPNFLPYAPGIFMEMALR